MPLTNAQYDLLMRRYQQRRSDAERLAQQRRSSVYQAIPALAGIDRQIASASLDALRQGGSDTSALRQRIRELSEQKRGLLREHGFPENYLDVQYTCPDCRDTGYFKGERCHCFSQAAADLLYSQDDLHRLFQEESFDAFDLTCYSDRPAGAGEKSPRQTAQEALKKAHAFIASFDEAPGSLIIYGNTGTGKTFLSHCIAGSLLQKGYTVIYLTAFLLFSVFEKAAFQKMDSSYNYSVDDIFNCDLLIIDDLGTEFSNAFTDSRLFQCINERLLMKRSTIISTNLDIKQLKEVYSERLFSRFLGAYTWIRLTGDDIRTTRRLSG